MTRQDLVARWFQLTREIMPSLATGRDWPVYLDHCFQRILLDNAVGGVWRDAIPAPAWRNADDAILRRAIALGECAVEGLIELSELNAQSLAWRGKGRKIAPPAP